MPATYIFNAFDVSAGGYHPASDDYLSVEPTGILWSSVGNDIVIDAGVSFVQVNIDGSVISSSIWNPAVAALGDYGRITVGAGGAVNSNETSVLIGGENNALLNSGTITGSAGVEIGGTGNQIVNEGDILGFGVAIVSDTSTSTSIWNSGTVYGVNQCVMLVEGTAEIVNTGSIVGGPADGALEEPNTFVRGNGIEQTTGSVLNLTNSGTISGGNSGVHLYDGSHTIANSGLISGGNYGIQFYDYGWGSFIAASLSVVNSGDISGTQAGIWAQATLDIMNTGTITALDPENGIGIHCFYGVEIVNAGTISGATAIALAGAADLVVNTGLIKGDVLLSGGNDTFNGTDGTVIGTVAGGYGNDLFILSDPNAALAENTGCGSDTVEASVSFTLAAGQEIETLKLTGTALRGTGNEFANTVIGNDEDNRLFGQAGADSLTGGLGNDTLSGGTENDTLSGGDGGDQVNGSDGNDVLNGQNDDDTLTGGAGTDKLNGNAGDDLLKGGAANDTLSGGDGDDQVTGGMGRDSMTGGNDFDTFVFTRTAESGLVASGTADVITDFTSGSDKIDLSAIDAKSGTAANDAFVFLGSGAFTGTAGQLHFVVSGPNLILEGDVTGDGVADFQIQLNGIATISAGDLVL